MGRARTVNLELPKRMLARKRLKHTWYYYSTPGPNRKEIPLGNHLGFALCKYEQLNLTEDENFNEQLPDDFVKTLFSQVKKRSVKNKLDINITPEFIEQMLIENDYRCSITRIKFNGRKYKGQRIRPWIPSVDRIDSRGGYTKENVRLICASVNVALNQFGDDIFNTIVAQAAKLKYAIEE